MAVLFALGASVLTSLLPIVNKHLLRDTPPALVAWVTNTVSLPILALLTWLFTQCSLRGAPGPPLACAAYLPQVDRVFVAALLVAAVLNWAATILSTMALWEADASLVSPLLTFNPAFTLLLAWFLLGEIPGLRQTLGVAVVLLGAYLLEVKEAQTHWLSPLRLLLRRPGTLLAILASALWGATTVLEKLAIDHMRPKSGPMVALLGTVLMVLLLTPAALFPSQKREAGPQVSRWKGMAHHPRALSASVPIAGIAPLFGFTAIAFGLVGYVTTLFKLSSVLTILWAWMFLGEGQIRERLLGAGVMVLGGLLVTL